MASSGSAIAPVARPSPEVVLPTPYYALLLLEGVALVALHLHSRAADASGREPHSYLLGWVGTASMVVMHVYSLRRRVPALRGLGKLRSWLHFHIFCGLQGALLVTYHSLHLQDLRTIQGINIALVGIVVASGLFGRYLFARLPRTISGEIMNRRQVEEELRALGPDPELLRRKAFLERRLATLDTAERFFRRWTLFHRPLTFVLFGVTALHILGHYLYGGG